MHSCFSLQPRVLQRQMAEQRRVYEEQQRLMQEQLRAQQAELARLTAEQEKTREAAAKQRAEDREAKITIYLVPQNGAVSFDACATNCVDYPPSQERLTVTARKRTRVQKLIEVTSPSPRDSLFRISLPCSF